MGHVMMTLVVNNFFGVFSIDIGSLSTSGNSYFLGSWFLFSWMYCM